MRSIRRRGTTPKPPAAFTEALDLFQYLNIAEEARQTEQRISQCDAKYTKDEA